MRAVRVVVGGDFCPQGANVALSCEGDAGDLFREVRPLLDTAHLSVVNLECPLIDVEAPAPKTGPVLGAPSSAVRILARAGIGVVGLANNHVMDHGVQGLENTKRVLAREGILPVGAGRDRGEANSVLVVERGGLRIGIMAMCEHEFGIAGPSLPGVNPLDPMAFVRSMRALPKKPDYLIVLLHAGNEFSVYPRPSLVDTCRFLIEEGANAVFCQHSHCVGCFERYGSGYIVYGQGNLLFDMPDKPKDWYVGVLAVLDVNSDCSASLDLHPFRQSRPLPGVHLMGQDAAPFLAEVTRRSRDLSEPSLLQQHWDVFCNRAANDYLRRLGTHSRLARGLDRVTGYSRWLYALDSARLAHLNIIRCESHREALINILSHPIQMPVSPPLERLARAWRDRVKREAT